MPTDYHSWIQYLDSIEDGDFENNLQAVLDESSCPEYKGIKSYFHVRIETAVNNIIESNLRDLKKGIAKFTENNEIAGLHILFVRFSKKINRCMFFCYIPFLDNTFKKKMYSATKKEVYNFWDIMLNLLQSEAKKNNNVLLDEELFLIERITLFDGVELNNGATNEQLSGNKNRNH